MLGVTVFGLLRKVEFSKWNWQKKQKLTIEATMTHDELKKFLEYNKITIKEDIASISSMKLIVTVQ